MSSRSRTEEDADAEPPHLAGPPDWPGGPQRDLQPAGAAHQAGPPGQVDSGSGSLCPWRLSLSCPACQVCSVRPGGGLSQW